MPVMLIEVPAVPRVVLLTSVKALEELAFKNPENPAILVIPS
jgi:hypothetical protein